MVARSLSNANSSRFSSSVIVFVPGLRKSEFVANHIAVRYGGANSMPTRDSRSAVGGEHIERPPLEVETTAIQRALQEHDGHRGHPAATLGIDKSTLW
jgi:DNA-binding NtrC family response regulator